jgi:hypothetical protein
VDYSLLGTARVEPLLRRIRVEMAGAGLRPESAKGECNLGQHEIAFRYDNALVTADTHSVYKQGANVIAADMGMSLTFMAKPNRREGNSCHIHFSLRDAAGVPIMDGSAENFAEIIERAGIVEQPLARRALLVREKVSYEQGNRRISVEPADTYQIDCLIDFSHPLIGVQSLFVELSNGAFSRDIAAARTFGFTEEIEALRRANLIRGGSLDNAIVLTSEGMLNETGLRFRDEFVRHKILDIIGDLALLGMPILGKVVAERSGHIMHAGLMSKLLRVRSAWDIVDMSA